MHNYLHSYQMTMLTGKEYIRYSRQIMLEEHGEQGQEALKAATVLIIGMGGLGCPVAQYLAAAGIGKLILVDDDKVEASNLHRQILYAESQVGELKVSAAKQRLSTLNSNIEINAIAERADACNLGAWIAQSTVVVDCSDNINTRRAINQATFNAHKPLVVGAAIRFEAQIISFDFSSNQTGCYQCLTPDTDDEAFNCSTAGVLGPVLGIAGSMQALSVIKAITAEHFVGNLWQCFDGREQRWLSIKHSGTPNCSVCGQK